MAYHVFLSFRGKDTRKTFTDHLYTALSGAGFRTFRDDDGIERGENVKSELDKSIKEARSSIVVFSKDYASSGWCLDELVMILERKRTSSGAGHVVLPVFYDVDPSQVRKQTGSFRKAFRRHEERLNAETNGREKEDFKKKVEVWRRALTEVADLAGMVLQNQADGHESKFIQNIVRVIGDKLNNLNRPVLHVDHNPIGIESRVRNINSWLHEPNSRIALIYVMGGIGKTTIADAEIINEMGLSSELENKGSLEVKVRNLGNQLYDMFGSIKKDTLQVLYECGISNIFLPKSEVPAGWCSSNKGMGSSITFNVPSLPNLKIQALKIYVVFFGFGFEKRCNCFSEYDYITFNKCHYQAYDYITLNNVTKGVKWAYSPLFRCIPPDNDMVWLSHWKIGNQLILEAGDEVKVSAGTEVCHLHVKEIGVHLVYDEPEERGSQHHKAYSRHQNVTNVEDLSAYQFFFEDDEVDALQEYDDGFQDDEVDALQEYDDGFQDDEVDALQEYDDGFQDDEVDALQEYDDEFQDDD